MGPGSACAAPAAPPRRSAPSGWTSGPRRTWRSPARACRRRLRGTRASPNRSRKRAFAEFAASLGACGTAAASSRADAASRACTDDAERVTYNHMVVGLLSNRTLSDVEADRVFHALADSTRRDILARAIEREQSVSALARHYEISLTAVQKHVAVLERAALVSKHRSGREQLVAAEPEHVAPGDHAARGVRAALDPAREPRSPRSSPKRTRRRRHDDGHQQQHQRRRAHADDRRRVRRAARARLGRVGGRRASSSAGGGHRPTRPPSPATSSWSAGSRATT